MKDKNLDKHSIEELEFKEECKAILTIDYCSDLVNIFHKNFHVEKQVRSNWELLEKAMFEEK